MFLSPSLLKKLFTNLFVLVIDIINTVTYNRLIYLTNYVEDIHRYRPQHDTLV